MTAPVPTPCAAGTLRRVVESEPRFSGAEEALFGSLERAHRAKQRQEEALEASAAEYWCVSRLGDR